MKYNCSVRPNSDWVIMEKANLTLGPILMSEKGQVRSGEDTKRTL